MPEIYDRGEEGFKVYVKAMANSSPEKIKILPYVKRGFIAEMGSGEGTVLKLLSDAFPESSIVGVDISETMVKLSSERDIDNVAIVEADMRDKLFKDESLDSIVFCSTLHEVFSYSGYEKETVEKTIEDAYDMLRKGGRIIIRDGVKPEEGFVYMKFKNEEIKEKFYRFVNDFEAYRIFFKKEKGFVKLRRTDAMEFMSKYMYDVNWDIEVKEQFGVYSLDEYASLLEDKGFRVVEAHSYLIDFLRDTYYEKDIELFEKKNNDLIKADYPDTTMILVGEKI